jgi:hypothetical protein
MEHFFASLLPVLAAVQQVRQRHSEISSRMVST